MFDRLFAIPDSPTRARVACLLVAWVALMCGTVLWLAVLEWRAAMPAERAALAAMTISGGLVAAVLWGTFRRLRWGAVFRPTAGLGGHAE